ncbi:MAG: hypothetical protein LC798_19695 [Chloroflexi bacterium]|nr:hypothetical protein [Chloroflexota bacterium]
METAEDRALAYARELARLRAENERLRQALRWVLDHDYGDTIVPPRDVSETLTAIAQFDGGGDVQA